MIPKEPSVTKNANALLICPRNAICPDHLILLDLITLITFMAMAVVNSDLEVRSSGMVHS
jgi:hypothetical protein